MTRAQLGRAEADDARGLEQLGRRDRLPLGVVGEHVGEAHERGLAVGVVGVVALDDRGDALRQPPAAGEDAADERVVDAELTALAVDALLRRAGPAVDLGGVARVGVHEDELADVVQQRGDHQAVAVLVADLDARAARRRAGWRRRAGGSARARRPSTAERSKKSKVRARVASACTASGESSSTALTTDSTRPRDCPRPGWRAAARLMTSATSDSTAATTSPARTRSSRDHAQQSVARLGEGRERLERLERGGQTTAVALVVAALRSPAAVRGAGWRSWSTASCVMRGLSSVVAMRSDPGVSPCGDCRSDG